MALRSSGASRLENEGTLRRFQQEPGTRAYVRESLDEESARLKMRYAPRPTLNGLRDLGYLVELEG